MGAERTDRGATPQASGHRLGRVFSRIVHVYRRRWFQDLAAGVFFLALLEISYILYPNPNLVPAMIVYGAFLVPVVFMVHLDDRLKAWEVPPAALAVVFFSAGAVGLALASTVELALFPSSGIAASSSPAALAAVGPIEEAAKMVVPLVLFALGLYRSVGAGVMVGLVSAMALSALEMAGYGFNGFLGNTVGDGSGRVSDLFKSPRNVLGLDSNLVLRSLLDPLAHGAYTMLICFVLWDERRKAGRFVLNGRVLVTFAADAAESPTLSSGVRGKGNSPKFARTEF